MHQKQKSIDAKKCSFQALLIFPPQKIKLLMQQC